MRTLSRALRGLPLLLSLALPSFAWAQQTPQPPPAPAPTPAPVAEATWVQASLVVKVAQREAAAEALLAENRRLGGWFASLSDDAVSLRVPVDQADTLIAFASAQGLVVGREYSSTDLTPQLVDLQARVRAREEVLAQYFAILPTAKKGAVLNVEREIVRVVREVESLRGQLRLLEHRATWASVDVSFQFRDRQAPVSDGSSSFEWLNTLNLDALVYEFIYADWDNSRPRPGVRGPVPEGFSAYRGRSELRAASPQRLLYRVRAERHDPQADAAFWKEATRLRMVAAGYTVVREQDLGQGAGFFLELAAPLGTEDYSYAVAVIPQGRKLLIAEIAGPVEVYEAQRAALLAAVEQLAAP